ncbi:YheC/YheD family protein [Paenibacillus psychroresistens]|uniref:YheC/YheD family protein n=1 Tax=Paenibacillus psychroresistens TaxID=1778678 RepID=A0A6B8RR02_9BACL|nr:YheC/YheD family protein [Paenibacillus psychroresistens]QGQ97816.1 YheC/YheD family protein [Paenibacillus psychroresistens]
MLTKSYQKIVGIMISPSQIGPPFTGQSLFAHLCELGTKWGILVFVFSPTHVDDKTATVQGYKYQASGWIKASFPLPDLIYDRAFFTSYPHYLRHQSAVSALQRLKKTPYLGRVLQGKWGVHKVLLKHPKLTPHIPLTKLFRQPSLLFRWLKEYSSVVLKPEAGSQGRGVLIITKSDTASYSLRGRSMQNRPIAKSFTNSFALLQWLLAFIGSRSYLIQQYLSLQTDDGNAFDIRVLMQKGRDGQWAQTGMAARVGQPTSITSNLHGGGKGAQVLPLLVKQFDSVRANQIIDTINQLSSLIPTHLEHHFGRLAELGLDIGIDQSGSIWVIEVNSKPGRAAARWFTQPAARYEAMSNPLQYARFLLQ